MTAASFSFSRLVYHPRRAPRRQVPTPEFIPAERHLGGSTRSTTGLPLIPAAVERRAPGLHPPYRKDAEFRRRFGL